MLGVASSPAHLDCLVQGPEGFVECREKKLLQLSTGDASSHVELDEAFLSELRLFVQLAFDGQSFYQQFWQTKNDRPFVFS